MEIPLAERLKAAVRIGTDAVFAGTQELVPVGRTGDLKDSGDTNVDWDRPNQRVVGSIVYRASYAAFVEFGTGLRGIGTYPYNLPETGTPFTGAWVYDFRGQGWIGHPSQPYMRPPLDSKRDEIMGGFAAQGFRV